MSDDTDAWAVALNIAATEAAEFGRLAATMGLSPVDILKMMVERVIRFDRTLGAYGLRGLDSWVSKHEVAGGAVDDAIRGLPLDIRPTGFMWPSDRPFPWTADECRAAVLGYAAKWSGDLNDFHSLVRGKWETTSDRYAVSHQS
jgi:hypothetical protein